MKGGMATLEQCDEYDKYDKRGSSITRTAMSAVRGKQKPYEPEILKGGDYHGTDTLSTR